MKLQLKQENKFVNSHLKINIIYIAHSNMLMNHFSNQSEKFFHKQFLPITVLFNRGSTKHAVEFCEF